METYFGGRGGIKQIDILVSYWLTDDVNLGTSPDFTTTHD